MDKRFTSFLVGVFLLSLSSLCYEVSLSYEFGFMFWTNISYLIVSVAMFGLGVGAIFGYFFFRRRKGQYFNVLQACSLLFSLSIVISIILISKGSKTEFFETLDLNRMKLLSKESLLFFLNFAILPAFPFFFSGICLSSALSYPTEERRYISFIYFADLLGAGMGSFLVTYLVPFLNAEGVIVFCSFVAFLSSFLFNKPSRRVILSSVLIIFILISSFTFKASLEPVPKKPLATYVKNGAEVLYAKWSPTSRVDVVKFQGGKIQFIVNGSYPVTVHTGGYNIDKEEIDPRYFMFYGNPSSVLLLGSGGGVEIAMALQKNAQDVIGVEINPVIVDMMLKEFSKISGNIYERDKVSSIVEDGRTYVNRSRRDFDLIENGVLGADALILPSSIVQMFSDTYVYTVEANMDYFNHLSEEGVAVVLVTSLMDNYNAVDAENGVSYRLLRQYLTTKEALERSGVDGENHIMIFRHVMGSGQEKMYRQTDYTFIFKKELTEEDVRYIISRAEEVDRKMRRYLEETNNPEARVFRFECIHAPYYERSLDLSSYAAKIPKNRDVSPTTDDHPYLYYTETGAPEFLWDMLYAFALFTLLCFIVPVAIERKMRFESPLTLKLIPYFLSLGIGYVLIQAVLIQRLTLFLGQPAYAFQVVLFSMLVFSGVGSFLTGRYIKDEKRLIGVLAALVALLTLYLVSISPFIYTFMPYGIGTKVLLSIIYLSPLSLLLGMPFPLGLRISSAQAKNDVIWMYAVNGGGSVIGSIVGMIIAFSSGFWYSFLGGVLIYGLALAFGFLALNKHD